MWSGCSETTPTCRRAGPSFVLAAVSCAAALAACGSVGNAGNSGNSRNAGTSGGDAVSSAFSQAVKYSDCMRSHGVPNFPDPSPNGELSITPASGINPRSPAFGTAQTACAKLQPGGPGGPQAPMTASQTAAALKFAECMRKHGLSSFPDPTTSASAGSGPTLDLRGLRFPIGPGLSPGSPAFRRAAAACGFRPPSGGERQPVPGS